MPFWRLLDRGALDVDPRTSASLGDFYADLTLAWRTASDDGSASFRALAAQDRTPVVEVPLARGASTQVTIVSVFPAEATSGKRADVAPREARFSVLLELAGRPGAGPGEPTPGPTAEPGAAPTPGTVPEGTGVHGGGGATTASGAAGNGVAVATDPLATTGAEALRLALLGVTAVGVRGLLLGAVRRRRRKRSRGRRDGGPGTGILGDALRHRCRGPAGNGAVMGPAVGRPSRARAGVTGRSG